MPPSPMSSCRNVARTFLAPAPAKPAPALLAGSVEPTPVAVMRTPPCTRRPRLRRGARRGRRVQGGVRMTATGVGSTEPARSAGAGFAGAGARNVRATLRQELIGLGGIVERNVYLVK